MRGPYYSARAVGSGESVKDAIAQAADKGGAHRISARPSTRHVRVEHEGTVLAESRRPVELEETGHRTRFYLPREDVRTDLLEATETTSHCPFKGDATYFAAPGAPDVFWVYEEPDQPD